MSKFGETPQEQEALISIYQNSADTWLKGFGDAAVTALGLGPQIPQAQTSGQDKDTTVSKPKGKTTDPDYSTYSDEPGNAPVPQRDFTDPTDMLPSLEYERAALYSDASGIDDIATVNMLLSTDDGKAILKNEIRKFKVRAAETRKAEARAALEQNWEAKRRMQIAELRMREIEAQYDA